LRDARALRGDVHRVGAQALFGELERDARPRARLEEEVDDRLSAERGHLLDRALADLLERFGGVEDESDLIGGGGVRAPEVLADRRCHTSPFMRTTNTPSLPSSSCTMTSTRSPGATLIFLPTTSGWIGSSRPPRSTRTARAMRAGRPKSASSSSAARTVRP